MKALVYYGPRDIRLAEAADEMPSAGEVRIRVMATGICGSDVHGYLGITGRRIPPMIMGHEFSGIVCETGAGVVNVRQGDRVTVQPAIFCGGCEFCKKGLTNLCANKSFLGVMSVNGSMAEYLRVPAHVIYKLPEGVDFIQGAMIEPLAVAYRAVKKIPGLEEKDVLIVGAGTIGLLVLQLVKLRGAKRVFVSDLEDFRLEVAKSLGADFVINAASGNVRDIIADETDNKGVDAALEAVGASPTVKQAVTSLKTGGTCVWIGNSAKMIDINMQEVVTRELNIHGTYIYTHKEFGETVELISKGGIDIKPVISRYVTLDGGPETFEALASMKENLIKAVIVGS